MVESILTSVEFEISLLLFISLAGYLIAARFNQSAVVGAIILGLIAGPSFLGLIQYEGFVENIAQFGVIVLLFVIGLEFKLRDIFNVRYGLIALLGVILPWIGGFLVARLFGYELSSAVFIGTALTATSTAIAANVLKEMGKLQTDVAKAIIGAAVIDDILALLALAVAQQYASAAGAISFGLIALTLVKAVAFIIAGTILGTKVLGRFVTRIDNSRTARKYPEITFIFAMMVAFLYAMFAEAIQLSAIVGSFIAGVSLGGIQLRNTLSYKEGAEYLHIIFASIFFVSLGILVEISSLSVILIIFLIILTIVAFVTKVVGCYLPARIQGFSHKDSAIIGFGMSPRGEMATIIALIGLNIGLIESGVFTVIVLMSLITTIITPVALRRWISKKDGRYVQLSYKSVR